MSGILSGKINPFLITIVSSQRKRKQSIENREQTSADVELQQLV